MIPYNIFLMMTKYNKIKLPLSLLFMNEKKKK